MMDEIKLLIVGSPTGDQVMTMTHQSLTGMLQYTKAQGINLGSGPVIGTYCDMAQNSLVATTLASGADALLLIDSDMMFPIDTAMRLIARDKAVVGAGYRGRKPPYHIMVNHLTDVRADGSETGLVEVDFIPSGVLLIRRCVLEATKYPWFFLHYGDSASDFVGNDVNFCRKARAAGFPIWCDFDLSRNVAHLGTVPIEWQG